MGWRPYSPSNSYVTISEAIWDVQYGRCDVGITNIHNPYLKSLISAPTTQ